MDGFDSLASGRLPQAIEISVWFAGREPVAVERPEFDEADDGSLAPARPADRRRFIAVPDADGSSEGGVS